MLLSLIGKIETNALTLNSKDAEMLKDLILQYPYCQGLQLMFTMALANIHSTKLKNQVQRAAVAMSDRMKLCQMVSNGEFEWVELMNDIEAQKKSLTESKDDFMLIERFLDNVGETSSDTLHYDISSAAISNLTQDEEDFEENQTISDLDYQDELINSFIVAEEKGELFVPKALNSEDFVEEGDDAISLKKIREKAFLSESLAKIYVKQHKYEQAIAIFLSLNLKYSKKITYFADQIRYLETILAYRNGEENKQKK